MLLTLKKKDNKEIIEQIHHEFNTAADILLSEAEEIIAQNEINDDKYNKLKKFGFNKTKEFTKLSKNIELFNKNSNLANIIKKYQTTYPLNKFITLQQVETICNKYNLVLGETSLYTGFVPKKNLKEIADFQGIKPEDLQNNYTNKYILLSIDIKNDYHKQFKPLFDLIIEKNISVDNSTPGNLLDSCYNIYNNIFRSSMREKYNISNEEYTNFMKAKEDINYFAVNNKRIEFKAVVECTKYYNSDQLLICAPEKDMDLKDVKKKGFQLFKTEKVNFPDPVVLKPIKHGFLILTAWGDEASDPLVLNPINN